MTDLTYYDLLQVSEDASDDVIRAAYRRLAKCHHPDTNPVDPHFAAARFRVIQEAYDLLRDPVRRNAYNDSLRTKQWYGHTAHNEYGAREASDVFATARTTLERLMRLMATTRDMPVGAQTQETRERHG